ncbi:tryptophan 5-hydroxylase 1 [Trichonephila clavipes]|nr:tryptophan 5-hydroxylase 1 [Trichonephila clavipes]
MVTFMNLRICAGLYSTLFLIVAPPWHAGDSRPTTGLPLAPCHDEFRGPRSDYVRQHSLSPKAKVLPFDPERTCQQIPLITTFQDLYFYTDSFDEAKEKMREFACTIKRPFGLRYNPYTQTVEILSNTRKIANLVSELKGDLCVVTTALKKIRGKQCK